MNVNESAKLARVEEKVISIEKWNESHAKDDNDRFSRMFDYMKERFDKTDKKLDTLWDNKNKQDGAFNFGKIVAGGIGGLLVIAIEKISFLGGH